MRSIIRMLVLAGAIFLTVWIITRIICHNSPEPKYAVGEIVKVKLTGQKIMVLSNSFETYWCRVPNMPNMVGRNLYQEVSFREYELEKDEDLATPDIQGVSNKTSRSP